METNGSKFNRKKSSNSLEDELIDEEEEFREDPEGVEFEDGEEEFSSETKDTMGAKDEEQLLEDSEAMEDSELEAIKARVREMEEEAEKLKQLQTEVDRQMSIGHSPLNSSRLSTSSTSTTTPNAGGGSSDTLSLEEKMEVDARSVYVGNVDYGATAEELEQHFHGCGSINRVTILCNKYDGHPKGFGYIEFTDRESVNTAMAMDESLFRARQIKVMPKRTNRPGLCRTDRPPSFRGAGGGPMRGRGGFRGRGRFNSRFPRRGGGFRGGSARGNYFSPY
ncbi:polyadenylate-binding protein 2 [Folsomia candida]|uniref:polyadenylate-binding protein 2 n=1 Tax=Folsomia candida TaxID=158441 RepID=UPI000B9020E5|nr:polyadenylate-binding protein 2 [Folsomia candida]